MRIFLLLSVVLSSAATYAKSDCKAEVIETYKLLGIHLEAESFSSSIFSDFNISVEEFNDSPVALQSEIYRKIRPITDVLNELKAIIDNILMKILFTTIDEKDPERRAFVAHQIKVINAIRSNLDACEIQKK